jgi:hypothetical protein
MKRCVFVSSTLILLALFSAGNLEAQKKKEGLGYRGWGPRAGITIDPDQFHLGLHIDAGNFAKNVRFQPSFEFGFGNDRVVGAINLDAHYVFTGRDWRPYLGGGLGVAITDHEHRGNDFDAGAGLNLVAGFEWGNARLLILELRAGLGDIPELKLTAGIGF